jgi:sulfatase modifying factor 1
MKYVASILLVLFLIISCSASEKKQFIVARKVQTLYVPPADKLKKSVCPDDMVEVDGNYCPSTDELCLYWVTNDGERTDTKEWQMAHPKEDPNTDRCGEFRQPVNCLVEPIHKHFCIDRYEYPNKQGQIPQDWMSFNKAKEIAKTENKRLCTHSEWTTAASGDQYLPYPFGDGYHRDKSCNIDNHASSVGLTGADIMKVANPDSDTAEKLRSLLTPSGSKEQCVSSWGVYDMSGNIDEWVVNESGRPYTSGLCSGHVFGVRNRSRPMTDGHNETFYWYETGMRGCKDIP